MRKYYNFLIIQTLFSYYYICEMKKVGNFITSIRFRQITPKICFTLCEILKQVKYVFVLQPKHSNSLAKNILESYISIPRLKTKLFGIYRPSKRISQAQVCLSPEREDNTKAITPRLKCKLSVGFSPKRHLSPKRVKSVQNSLA